MLRIAVLVVCSAAMIAVPDTKAQVNEVIVDTFSQNERRADTAYVDWRNDSLHTLAAAFLLSNLPRDSTDAITNSANPFSVQETERDGRFLKFSVSLTDLTCEVRARRESSRPGLFIDSISLHSPFLVRDRLDLVDVLKTALLEADGDRFRLAYLLAILILPHIDDAIATLMYLNIKDYNGEGSVIFTWPRGPRPMPDDAASPPIWSTHTGNSIILDDLERKLAAADWTSRQPPIELDILATSDSPRALNLLRRYFEEYPEKQAPFLESIIWSSRPLAAQPWSYFLNEILPPLVTDPSPTYKGYWTLYIWFDLVGSDVYKQIAGFEWRQVEPLGERFVQTVLDSPQFNEFMTLMSDGQYKSEIPEDHLVVAMSDNLMMFFDICERFGTSRQLPALARAMKDFEEVLESGMEWKPTTLERRSRFSTPPFTKTSYPARKAAVEEAMKNRRSSLKE